MFFCVQTCRKIESFLGIPKREIGKIEQGKNNIGKQITIVMIQSLKNLLNQKNQKNI